MKGHSSLKEELQLINIKEENKKYQNTVVTTAADKIADDKTSR